VKMSRRSEGAWGYLTLQLLMGSTHMMPEHSSSARHSGACNTSLLLSLWTAVCSGYGLATFSNGGGDSSSSKFAKQRWRWQQ